MLLDQGSSRRQRSPPQPVNQAQDFPKQVVGHRSFSHLEDEITIKADDHGADLDQLLAQREQRPEPVLFGQGQCLFQVQAVL